MFYKPIKAHQHFNLNFTLEEVINRAILTLYIEQNVNFIFLNT